MAARPVFDLGGRGALVTGTSSGPGERFATIPADAGLAGLAPREERPCGVSRATLVSTRDGAAVALPDGFRGAPDGARLAPGAP